MKASRFHGALSMVKWALSPEFPYGLRLVLLNCWRDWEGEQWRLHGNLQSCTGAKGPLM